MRAGLIMGLALCAGLTACAESNTGDTVRQHTTNVQAVEIGGVVHRCLNTDDIRLSTGGTGDLKGDIRRRMLTPEADAAGVRVYLSGSDVNNYGSVVVHYATSNDSCVLWSETLPVQEYAQRIGMSPMGISPFYQVDAPKAAPATVAPTPAPTPTPTPESTPTPPAG